MNRLTDIADIDDGPRVSEAFDIDLCEHRPELVDRDRVQRVSFRGDHGSADPGEGLGASVDDSSHAARVATHRWGRNTASRSWWTQAPLRARPDRIQSTAAPRVRNTRTLGPTTL